MSARSRGLRAHSRDCSSCATLGAPRITARAWRGFPQRADWRSDPVLSFLNRARWRSGYFCDTPERFQRWQEKRTAPGAGKE